METLKELQNVLAQHAEIDKENISVDLKDYDAKVKFLMDLPSASMSSRAEDSQSEVEIFDDKFKPEEFYFSPDEGVSQNQIIVNISDKEDYESSTNNQDTIDKDLDLEKSIDAFQKALEAQIEFGESSQESIPVPEDTVKTH